MKQSYHTSLQIAYALGILPENIIRTIPSSTLCNWKNRGYQHMIGLDYAIENNEKIETLRTIAQSKRLYEISRTLVLIAVMYRKLIRSSKDRKLLMLAHKQQIIQTIEAAARCFIYLLERAAGWGIFFSPHDAIVLQQR